jgi:hypothetical protein
VPSCGQQTKKRIIFQSIESTMFTKLPQTEQEPQEEDHKQLKRSQSTTQEEPQEEPQDHPTQEERTRATKEPQEEQQ